MKVFLGAAPGVGKTYEMLVQARRRKLESVDVGHWRGRDPWPGRDRPSDQGLGKPSPRSASPYKGRVLAEMDMDAILQRRPRLVLVDELAHDNAPGSRHPKRYMDVEELLAAGIDVYTTLNVQHVESLNDVVAQITKVRVRETVPDSILDRADDIELVDLTPEDLLQRLKDGKVYMPDAAERAAQNYFHARQSGGAARTGAAPHRPAGGCADGGLYARPRHRRAMGSQRKVLLVAVNARPGAASAIRYAGGWPIGCGPPGRRSISRPAPPAMPNATGWPSCCAWPNAWAAWRQRCPPPARPKA